MAMKKILRIFPVILMGFSRACAGDLFSISLNYCNTPEGVLKYHLDPGIGKSICYTISNSSNTPTTIKLSFIDGTFTHDALKNKACLTDADVDKFWKYVTGYEQFITLKAWETIQKNAQILYPKGMDGIYYGCIAYTVIGSTGKNVPNVTGFTVLMRRARFIDITVGNPKTIKENIAVSSEKKNIISRFGWITQGKVITWISVVMRHISVIGIVVLMVIILFLLGHKRKKHKKTTHHHPHRAK